MYEKVNEQISVLAYFSKKETKPIYFSWKKRSYKINSINFVHVSKAGSTKMFHFSVTANNETYKISFNPIKLTWTLNEIYTDNLESTKSLNEKRNIKAYA